VCVCVGGCVGVWVCGCVGVWVCVFVFVCACVYVCTNYAYNLNASRRNYQ